MKKGTILCVDDEKVVLTSLKTHLKMHFGSEYSIETAENGDDALELIKETLEKGNELPVIISDHIMPGMKGDELLIKVHHTNPRTLSIMLTGQASAESVGKALNQAKLYRYISKPWDEKDLEMTVAEALRSYFQDKKIEEQNIELAKLVHQLKQYNETLEEKVRERTEKIYQQKKEIQIQAEYLEKANKEITIQKETIEKSHQQITSSIEYASRIQNAILTKKESFESLLQQHFIFFKPKDIVSGDFYFLSQLGNTTFIAAADCTGHGVPGAFMSMLGMTLLNEILLRTENIKADQILNELRDQIKKALQQKGELGEQQDGMDIAICAINNKTLIMSYAGAHNPCFIFRPKTGSTDSAKDEKAELIELPADNMPVSIFTKEKPFTEQVIQLKKGDTFYIFSDGFHSQFGGDNNEKYKARKFKLYLSTINHIDISQQKKLIEKEFYTWKGKHEQTDDILVMGVRI